MNNSVCYTIWDYIPKGDKPAYSKSGGTEQNLDDEQLKQDMDSLGIDDKKKLTRQQTKFECKKSFSCIFFSCYLTSYDYLC
jgi:hypothetical protein